MTRASTLNVWKRTNKGASTVSIQDEIVIATTVEASGPPRNSSHCADQRRDDKPKQRNGKTKRCAHCNSPNYPTEKHRRRSEEFPKGDEKVLDDTTREQLRKEIKMFQVYKAMEARPQV